jgi:predicted lactoylglutathione lyase
MQRAIAHQERLSMIGYVTLGTNDLARAAKFYAADFRDLDGNKLNFFHFTG